MKDIKWMVFGLAVVAMGSGISGMALKSSEMSQYGIIVAIVAVAVAVLRLSVLRSK